MYFVFYLYDNDEKEHDSVALSFDDGATVGDLKNRVCYRFHIRHEYQIFSVEGKPEIKICYSNETLSDIGLQNGDKIIVKHKSLSKWDAYKEQKKLFDNAEHRSEKIMIAKKMKNTYYYGFNKCNFLIIYLQFHSEAREIYKPIGEFLDVRQVMKKAAAKFFKDKDVTFGEAEGGSRAAILCNVPENDGENIQYRIKTIHTAGQSITVDPEPLDNIELFIYKFCEKIQIGPQILFIPNNIDSGASLYIASKMNANFKRHRFIQWDDEDALTKGKLKTSLVQIYFLIVCFSLYITHDDNFGIDTRDFTPLIVDFGREYRRPEEDIKSYFYQSSDLKFSMGEDASMKKYFIDVLKECSPDHRRQIIKYSNERWNFLESLDETFKFFEKEQEIFEKSGLTFHERAGISALSEYIQEVKTNFNDLIEN